jgi:polyisoprenoid-binding protein YceI
MRLKTPRIVVAALAASLTSSAAVIETYTIDPVHSTVAFSIRHFMAKVPGKFAAFSGTITVDRDDPERSSATATIDAASIDTGNLRRDNHLRSPDFFDVAKYPAMTFKSTTWERTGEHTFDVTGDLTLKGVTKSVVLRVTSLGFGAVARGGQLPGWEATTTIDKAEFNLKDPPLLGAALGNAVTITIRVQPRRS